MDYEKRVKQMIADEAISKEVAAKYFPELAESEDERIRKALKEYFVNSFQNNGVAAICGVHIKDILAWLEKQGEQKPAEWSKEDERNFDIIYGIIYNSCIAEDASRLNAWLLSLRPQSRWKPSEEMLEALYRAIPENVMEISEDEMLLDKLYQGLKYGRVLSNK